MSSLILKDLLKHKVRKQILKKNKTLNHKAFVKSMQLGQKIPFLMKYHKKKLVFLLVLGIITWNYSLHKSAYHWILGMRPPHKILLGLIVDMPDVQKTISELSMHKVSLSQDTKDLLAKLHYQSDKFLYFGLGRKFLYHVYTELGMLQTEDQQKMFWQKSQFFKKRNQLASGVGLVQNLIIFEQALKKKKQKNPEITEESFRDDFIKKCLELAPFVMKWEKQFNAEREKQFIKNVPGLSETKKQTVSQIMKEQPEITIQQIQNKLSLMGLRGLNLSQKFYFYRSKQVWQNMKELNVRKRLSHLTINMNLSQKRQLQRQLDDILTQKSKLIERKNAIQAQYQKMYEKQLL